LAVNLNPEKPQHHNIHYVDMQSSYGQVYENNRWVTKKIDEILNKLIDAKIKDLYHFYDETSDIFNEKTKKRIKNSIKKIHYPTPEERKNLESSLKINFIKHKDMVLNTKMLSTN
jgi:hypothetical protein